MKQAPLFTPPEQTMLLTIESARDKQGRCRFTLEWRGYRPDLHDDGLRAQVFFARPEDHVRDLERRGWVVRTSEAQEAA